MGEDSIGRSSIIVASLLKSLTEKDGLDYFQTPTIITLKVADGKEKVIDIKNVFEDVSIQSICYKLFHNILGINHYSFQTCINISDFNYEEDLDFKPNDNYELKVQCSFGRIQILENQLSFMLNNKRLARTLYHFVFAIQDYIRDLVERDPRYKKLLSICALSTDTIPQKEDDFFIIFAEFIENNIDFFESYIDKDGVVKKLNK